MRALAENQVSGLALMIGVLLVFVASAISTAAVAPDLIGETSSVEILEIMGDNAAAHIAAGAITLVAIFLMAVGAGWLLRIPREETTTDNLLRVGVFLMLVAWVFYAIEIGMQFIILEVATATGVGEDLADGVLDVLVTFHFFGFVILGAVSSFLVGLGVAKRFDTHILFVIAGYGLLAKGVVEIANVLLSVGFGVEIGFLLYISNALLLLGGVFLFVIGLGIYQGKLHQPSVSIGG